MMESMGEGFSRREGQLSCRRGFFPIYWDSLLGGKSHAFANSFTAEQAENNYFIRGLCELCG